MHRLQNMVAGGDSELRCAISPIITDVYMYVLDMMYIMISGFRGLEVGENTSRGVRGRISKGNDVWGNVRAENRVPGGGPA